MIEAKLMTLDGEKPNHLDVVWIYSGSDGDGSLAIFDGNDNALRFKNGYVVGWDDRCYPFGEYLWRPAEPEYRDDVYRRQIERVTAQLADCQRAFDSGRDVGERAGYGELGY